MEQVRQRIIAGYHLRPLDRQEVQAYVEHRLALVGWRKDPLITDAAFDALFSATGGVPRRVNNLCDRLLLFGSLEELHELSDAHVQTVVEEMAQEVGQGPLESDQGSAPTSRQRQGKTNRPTDMPGRVELLEQEVEQLRAQLSKTRRLVKQAILLQMDSDDDDEGQF
jgi:hypothetical protein